MFRASWKGALFAALASAGVAWGQSAPVPTAARQSKGKIVTLQQKGGSPQQCRVLRTWTTETGQTACLLQALDTDELLTVVQTGSRRGARQVGAQIFRWGNEIMPPKGSPVPPSEGAVHRAAYTSEESELPEPHLAPLATTVMAPAPVFVGGCTVESCGKDKAHCGYVHHYEKPPSVTFMPGHCVPVCPPEHAPNYGYFPTQWTPWPGGFEAAPGMTHE